MSYLPLVCLALLHLLVDTCAFLIEPLWGELKKTLLAGETALFVTLTLQAIAPNLSQLFFGLHRDRAAARYLLWAGPATAVVCLSAIGFASNATALSALLVVGGIGVGAFHPEGAVTAGQLLPAHRTRAVSLFLLGGTLGLGLSPLLSALVVERFGLRGLAYLGPGILAAMLAAFAVVRRHLPHATHDATARSRTLSQRLEGRWGLMAAIWIVCSLRLVPNMAMTKVLSLALTEQGESLAFVGLAQATFVGTGGVGMLLLAWLARPGSERTVMLGSALGGIPCLLAIGWADCPQWLLLTTLVPAGLILWGTTPVQVAFAHRCFPHAAGLASAITMGLSFGLAGLIQAAVTSACDAVGRPQTALLWFVPCLILSAIGAALLPTPAGERVSATESVADEGAVAAPALEAAGPR